VTVASPLILYLVVKATAAGIAPAAALALASLPPADPSQTLKILSRLVQQPTFRPTPETVGTAERGLAALPLAFEPFFVAARVAEQRGDLRRATILMEEARHRRPSYPAVRMQLMIYYTKAQRFPEALEEVDVVLRRNGELRPLILPELTKLIADPRGRQALAGILATEPEWREDFFKTAAGRRLNPADARDLYQRVRALKPRGDLRMERELILQAQASIGDHAGARQTILSALPEQERAANRFIFDPSFRGRPIPNPFAWRFQDVDVGRAEPARDSGRSYLDVAYFGGRSVVLADQVLALRPGRYTLRSVARSDNGISAGTIYWRISCLPGQTQLVAVDLSRAGAADRRFAAGFSVPASACPSQLLSLVAEPGDVAAVVNLQVSGLEIAQ
jgi:hypothetical protein